MGPLLRWFVFSVGFGLLPFAFSVLLRLLHGEPPALVRNAPELLFLALMLSAIQMGESAGAGRSGRRLAQRMRSLSFCFFLLLAIFAAVAYGVYVQGTRETECPSTLTPRACRDPSTFESNVFSLSMWIAAMAAAVGTIAG